MVRSYSLIIFLFSVLALFAQENRTITGSGNNLNNSQLGMPNTPLLRVSAANYADGFKTMNDAHLPIPRKISNQLFEQTEDHLEASSLSDFVWLFGQFIDHDISLTENGHEVSLLELPEDEEVFTEDNLIFLSRNAYDPNSGDAPDRPRVYNNMVTSYIDASMVYGSDEERANWLRTFDNGELKVWKPFGEEEYLPWNTITGQFGDPIDNSSATFMADDTQSLDEYFVAGDIRANENVVLTAIHTLFVREHNRLCRELSKEHPTWNDERLYQRARKLVGAYIQAIVYYEWLPALGVYMPKYQGYRPSQDPTIFNVFSAAAFRIGHTMIDGDIVLMNNNGEMISRRSLDELFFNPQQFVLDGGPDPYFKGMGTQVMQEMDCKMVDDLRNFLFKDSQGLGLDLASINIFRGRDRGLPDYNTLRADWGLPKLNSFSDITNSQEDVNILEELYQDVNNIDAWVGMLSEQHVDEKSAFGPLVMRIIKEQFRKLREGDRFYFENDPSFSPAEIAEIKNTTMHDLIMRNTNISLMQPNVFVAMPHTDIVYQELEQVGLTTLVFPNPVNANTVVRVYSDKIQQGTYKLMNAEGRLLKSGTMNLVEGDSNYIDLSFSADFDKGFYTLLLETESEYSVTKLVK